MANLGFNFGAAKPATSAGAFAMPIPSTATTTSLFGTPASTAGPTPGFNFGTPVASTATATPGFNFGATPIAAATTAPVSGFTLGGAATTSAPAGFGTQPTTSATGLGSLLTAPVASTAPYGFAKPLTLGATPATATSAAGFALGTPATATSAAGFALGTPATTSSGLGFGLKLGATTTTTPAMGFGSTATTSGSTSIFGLGSTAATSGNTSIFGQATAKTTTVGLGGVDPKTTTTTSGTASDGSKTSDGKTVKEAQVQNEILADISNFKKFVKEEKAETEHIKRMSSTPMVKVQEDTAALKQLLSVASNGLQRNACAVDKLKREMTQELKNAEMAMRTKDTPPGLQYENTAPTEYFHQLVGDFESQMLNYRQQIELLETHLASLHQPNRLTAEDLIVLLRKLHEAFIAMAAQLQQVHEAIKTQKEHYLTYRKVFLGDSRNIFEQQKRAPVKVAPIPTRDQYGQNPFPGINNAAAIAMAAALTRAQQPQAPAQPGGGPPATGFSNLTQTTGFGAPTANPAGFAGFGSATSAPITQASGFKGFGTSGAGLFGGTSNLATTQQTSTLFNLANSTAANLSASTEQPFQLNKPPGTKRGKR